MRLNGRGVLLDSEGKGFLGCMASIVLIAVMIFAGLKLGPVYYTNYLFEEDLKKITSQAGARFMSNDKIIEDILKLANKNNINIKLKDVKENVKIERFAGQLHINVRYYVPVDFLIMKKTLKFQISLSSFTST